MKNERLFLRCARCGNIISFLKKTGPNVICCGEQMKELTPNTTDAAQEKHVPASVREGNKLIVTVGSVPHPMTEEHQIEWIIIAQGQRTQRFNLSGMQEPKAEFAVDNDPVTIYEYCNLHGLWKAEA